MVAYAEGKSNAPIMNLKVRFTGDTVKQGYMCLHWTWAVVSSSPPSEWHHLPCSIANQLAITLFSNIWIQMSVTLTSRGEGSGGICSLLVFSFTNCPRVTPQQMRSRHQLLRMAAAQMAKPLVGALCPSPLRFLCTFSKTVGTCVAWVRPSVSAFPMRPLLPAA